jgi:hypothetical protein
MSRHLTADEVRQQYITAMGQDLGAEFYGLYNEVAWLHVRRREYVVLVSAHRDQPDRPIMIIRIGPS